MKRTDILEKEQEIRQWISRSLPNAEIARRLQCKVNTLKSYYKKMGIEYAGNMSRKGIKRDSKRKPAKEFVLTNASNSAKRKRLIEDGIKEAKCERCQLSEWMGQPIPLELHHIDFNHYNNDLSNLQILCSNCHMQIHNYNNCKKEKIETINSISDTQKIKERNYKECPVCHKMFNPRHKEQKYCSQECSHKLQQKGMPSKEIMIEKMKEFNFNFTQIGKYFGVSDSAIRKWCNKLELPERKQEIKIYIDNITINN